jgi:6-pyruvoyl-tetrahydropterin synthase
MSRAGAADCSLTRVIALHATHRFSHGGPPDSHGHLYRIEVTVRAAIDATRRTVIDLATLDAILTREVAEPLAGRHLNDAIAEFSSGEQLPTCEAFAAWCWRTIAPRLPEGTALERVRVAEDGTLWADCTGFC